MRQPAGLAHAGSDRGLMSADIRPERVERLTRRLLAFGASTATARRIATAAVYGFEFLLEDQRELDRAQLAPAIRQDT